MKVKDGSKTLKKLHTSLTDKIPMKSRGAS